MDDQLSDFNAPVEIPITGELDLHTFAPRMVKEVVLAYIEACQEKGIRTVRIVHGKGIGALRETVHAILRRHPAVVSFHLAGEQMGGWGATLAHLRPMKGLKDEGMKDAGRQESDPGRSNPA